MMRIACAIAASVLLGRYAQAADLALNIATADGPSWQAQGLELRIAPPASLQLDIARIAIRGRPALRHFRLRCDALVAGAEARCENAAFTVDVPGWGTVRGLLSLRFHDAKNWTAALDAPRRGLKATLTQTAAALHAKLDLHGQPAGALQRLAAAFKFEIPGEVSGDLDLGLEATLAGRTEATLTLKAKGLSYSETSGRYATDKLSASAELRYDQASRRWQSTIDSTGGQAYTEPFFFDFAALPLHAEVSIVQQQDGWNLERLQLDEGKAGQIKLSGQLAADFKPLALDADIDAADLTPLLATYVQPLLIGTPLDGSTASGRGSARLSMRDRTVRSLHADLDGVSVKAGKLGLALNQISGNLDWLASGTVAPSKLRWLSGAIERVPLDASAISFQAMAKTFTLLTPWRQPLLGGALQVETLALRNLGGASLSADFKGAVEPIDLGALCQALDWPKFGGTLGGRLPGLTVRDNTWAVDGALDAQVFDGRLRLDNLRATDPFGVLPQIAADIEIRRLDLEALTSAFSFGRISGRLDGDINGLRLLNWSPVAFDTRLYSTPGDHSTRRISQRAIDNISSIGGGPTGVLSRGFLSIFKDFAYSQLGISCVLRNGVCRMGGVEPAPPKAGMNAYYLVEGRLLPRIDVVGYNARVSWNQLLQQLEAARSSGGPQVK